MEYNVTSTASNLTDWAVGNNTTTGMSNSTIVSAVWTSEMSHAASETTSVAPETSSFVTDAWTNTVTDLWTSDVSSESMSSALSSDLTSANWIKETTSAVTNYFTETLTYVGNDTVGYNRTTPPVIDFVTTATTVITYITSHEAYKGIPIDALVLKTVSLVLIALSGVAGNGFIIYTIVKEGNLHRPPFYYLLSLCVSDLSRAVFCVPLVLMTVLQGSVWKYGTSACKLFAFANSFFIYSSSGAILAISIDRHFSIVYSKFYKRRSRGLVNLIVVVVGWTIAFAMSFPPVVGIGTYVFIPEESQCTFHHRYYKSNDTLGFMLVFSVIVFVSVFLYLRVFSFLRSHRKMRPLEHQPARSSNWTFFGPGANGQALVNVMNGFGANPAMNPLRMQVRPNFGRVVNLHIVKNEHLTRLFFVVTCSFSSLWFPYIVLAFWRMFGDTGTIGSVFVTIAAWLTYTQVALCPLMYIVSRGPIRKHSRTVLDANDKKEFLLETRNRK
ncbi:probable G protein-coupled receptor 85 [Haliotis rufescens]|uniref:probable G protein-coupled receptor 85 n=1 Tax=Haliotis rufescens TaxID=6454 RepID=UPI00201F90EF|nr:probable G protein-coupled receptor 85 [Haliotis rufescens]XP_048243152.1 probable G protein-coupled receptor 85 [Haliotis rufescens]